MADDARVGAAYVEISPKLAQGFATKLKSDVDGALKPLERSFANLKVAAGDAVSGLSGGSRAAQGIKTSLDGASNSAKGLRGAANELDRASASGRGLRSALDGASTSSVKLSEGGRALIARADDLARKWEKVPDQITRSGQALDRTEQSTAKLGNTADASISKIVRQAAALTAAYAGVSFFRGVINDASDLSESTSKAENVFKDATATVKDFAKSSATSFGIANKDALEMGATFGNLLTSMGLTRQESANMSVSLLKLAADFASFNNISINEALEKIRSGLVGEFEPLRSLGVTLSAVAVGTKAVELGLASNAKQASASAKIQATYALIMEQSKNAQGDFARTSTGLANSQRSLNALWTESKEAIGQVLLPTFLELVSATKEILPQLQDLGEAFGGVLGKGLDAVIPGLKIVAFAFTAIAPVLDAIPAPLIAIAANLFIVQKALDKLGIEKSLLAPFKKLGSSLSDAATNSMNGLGAKMAAKAAKEAAIVQVAAAGPRGFVGPIETMFTTANPKIAAAADKSVQGVGGKINKRIQSELADVSAGRRIEGPLSAMFTRAKVPLAAAASATFDGLGSTVSKKLVTEFQRATRTPEQALKELGASMRRAQETIVSDATRAASAVQPKQGLFSRLFGDAGREAADAAAQTEKLAVGTRSVSSAISTTKIGAAAEETGKFGSAVGSVAGVALPALGVALGIGTTALGIWQQKRAEAQAAQEKWTASMLADAQAITAAGGSISDAVKGAIGEQTKAAVTQELQDKKRFDDLQRITDSTGGNTSALKLYLDALQAVNDGQGKNNDKVKEFRRLLLSAGEIKLEPIAKDFVRPGDLEEAKRRFIDLGEEMDNFNITGNDSASVLRSLGGGPAQSGLFNQFNSDLEKTADSTGAVNAQLREIDKSVPKNAVQSMKTLDDTVKNTKDTLKDATDRAKEFSDAIDRLGGPATSATEAEEARQQSINRALDTVTNQDIPTTEDLTAAQEKATDAANKRAQAEAKLAEATANGTEEDKQKAAAGLHSAQASERSAAAALEKTQRQLEEGGLNAQEIIFGNTDEAIGARQQFRDVVKKTLDQAKLINDQEGTDAAAAFWDTNIQGVRDRSPEFAEVLDAEIARLGITDGRSIFFRAAMDPQAPLTPQLAEFLDTAALQEKVIKVAVDAEGDIPADLVPIISDRLNDAQKIHVITEISSQLGPDQQIDPGLLQGLSDTERKSLALDLSVINSGASQLPVEILEPLLKTDAQFTKNLLLNLRAEGTPVDENSPIGKAFKAATDGTPLSILLAPTVQATAPAGSPEADLLGELAVKKAEIAKTKLEGDIASPEFHGSISTLGDKFDELQSKIDLAKRTTQEFEAVHLNPKTVDFLVEGGERFNEAKRQYQEFKDEPDINKRVTLTLDQVGISSDLASAARAAVASSFPGTAIGGIFNDPQVRLIAEAGQEAVIPMADSQHARAAQLLAEGGFFQRFAGEFAQAVGAAGARPTATVSGGSSIVQNFYTNDAEVVARKVAEMQVRALTGTP